MSSEPDLARLIEGLGGRRVSTGWAARCPAHDDRNPSLSIGVREGRVLVHCFSGCDQAAVIDALRRRGLWPEWERGRERRERRIWQPPKKSTRDFGLSLWRQAMPLHPGAWPPTLCRYFEARGLVPFEPCLALRFHPRLRHSGDRFFPALLALASDIENEPRAVQATWLAVDGSAKAAVEPARKTFGSAGGAAVRLIEGDDVLVVGEGVESVLSAIQALGEGGYALLGTSGLKAIALPEIWRARRVIIAADNDESGAGLKAAHEAARRLVEDRGFLDVCIALPPDAGTDFNDRLRSAA